MISDTRKLVRNCLKHHRKAQKELYDAYAPDMLGVCYRYTKNIHDAEDVLQEGFIKVFENLRKYRGEGELGAWIRRIMVNTSLTYLRRHRRYRDEMIFEEHVMHPVDNNGNPEIMMTAKELAAYIRELPIGYQTIFNLYAVEGYSHTEIAQMLHITDSTSRSQYARARYLLVKKINQVSDKEKGGENAR